ncbi:hypothetical protein INP77_12550 [Methylophilus sp. 13]|uniref:hypothetical protein n=1 Tax=Methylophilus sp. 13 TaxID=2781018 RepID=UPI00189046CA|nr:hypothetical protein [Methylophilus sp. 13]MBF5040322.1 hypothetical protein [Methylophilus sp. 13]
MLKTVPNNQINTDVSEALVRFENPTNGLAVERLAKISRDKSLVEIDLATCQQLGFDLDDCQYKQITRNGVDEINPIVGPLRVYLNNRFCDCCALVTGIRVEIGNTALQML